jgi:putative hemolysin
MTVFIVVALVLCVLASAFLTAAELAVFSVAESRVRTVADEGIAGGGALQQLRSRPERLLVLLRIGDTVADVSAGALAAYLSYLHWEFLGLALAVGGVSFLILYFGELLPMGFAITRGLRFALALAPGLLVLTRVLKPVLVPIATLAGMSHNRREGNALSITESEIRQLTALSHTEGGIEAHERDLIERAFRMDKTRTWDIMTPRVDIFAWRGSLRLAEIAPQLGSVPYSRVPVYGESVDDITGILYVRDAYQALLSGQRDVRLRALAREPLIVPGSLPLAQLLRDFQTRRIHLALVVDEYGGTDGLVTLEDVLEELVGEIVDETDVAEEPMIRVSRSEVVAAGDVDLREVNHYFNAAFPQLEHRSLNGYILEELGRVPAAGEHLERDGIRLEILEATETQVTRVRLRRHAAPATPAPAADSAGARGPSAHPLSAAGPSGAVGAATAGTRPARPPTGTAQVAVEGGEPPPA